MILLLVIYVLLLCASLIPPAYLPCFERDGYYLLFEDIAFFSIGIVLLATWLVNLVRRNGCDGGAGSVLFRRTRWLYLYPLLGLFAYSLLSLRWNGEMDPHIDRNVAVQNVSMLIAVFSAWVITRRFYLNSRQLCHALSITLYSILIIYLLYNLWSSEGMPFSVRLTGPLTGVNGVGFVAVPVIGWLTLSGFSAVATTLFILPIFMCMLLTVSRTLLVVTALCFLLSWRKLYSVLVVVTLGVTASVFMVMPQRYEMFEDAPRIQLIEQMLVAFIERPLFGQGAGALFETHHSTYETNFLQKITVTSKSQSNEPWGRVTMYSGHNVILQLAAEGGIVGVFLFLVPLVFTLSHAANSWRRRGLNMSMFLIALNIVNLTESIYIYMPWIAFIYNYYFFTSLWMEEQEDAVCRPTRVLLQRSVGTDGGAFCPRRENLVQLPTNRL